MTQQLKFERLVSRSIGRALSRELDLAGVKTGVIPAGPKSAKPIGIGKDDSFHTDYNKVRPPADYEREITELQEKLEMVDAQLARGSKRKFAWYETLATLTPQERDIMRSISKLKKKGLRYKCDKYKTYQRVWSDA